MEIKLPRRTSLEQSQAEPTGFSLWFHKNREAVAAWAFLGPMIVYFCIMTFVPMAFLVAVSLTEWNIIDAPRWVGLEILDHFLELSTIGSI